MTSPTSRESDKFVLRLPDGMRDRIKAAAEANNRSMNAEIVSVLEREYPAPRQMSADLLGQLVALDRSQRDRVIGILMGIADQVDDDNFLRRIADAFQAVSEAQGDKVFSPEQIESMARNLPSRRDVR